MLAAVQWPTRTLCTQCALGWPRSVGGTMITRLLHVRSTFVFRSLVVCWKVHSMSSLTPQLHECGISPLFVCTCVHGTPETWRRVHESFKRSQCTVLESTVISTSLSTAPPLPPPLAFLVGKGGREGGWQECGVWYGCTALVTLALESFDYSQLSCRCSSMHG